MRTRFLSPSRLLQERINDIRDANEPLLKQHLIEERKRNDKLKRNMDNLQQLVFRWGDAVKKKFGEKEFEKILDKV